MCISSLEGGILLEKNFSSLGSIYLINPVSRIHNFISSLNFFANHEAEAHMKKIVCVPHHKYFLWQKFPAYFYLQARFLYFKIGFLYHRKELH